jgi:hypothetical protein
MMIPLWPRIVRWLIAVTAIAVGGGCPRLSICVKSPDQRASSFVIEVAEGSECNEPAQVTRVLVRRVSDGTVLWNIGSKSIDGVELTSVRYGELPAGFDQGLVAQPLTPGDHVGISVNGRGASGGIDVTIAP